MPPNTSTHSSRKNVEIERLRAVAVLLLIFTHFHEIHPALPASMRYAITGVDLFFVISGYVVTLSLLRIIRFAKADSSLTSGAAIAKRVLGIFYSKRVLRILPAAFAWIAISLIMAALHQGHPSQNMFGTPRQLIIEAAYFVVGFYNYLIQFVGFPINYLGPYWSLTVEEHFYFLLPWMLLCIKSKRGRILATCAGIATVAVLLRPLILVPANWVPISFEIFSSHRRFDTLLLGVLLALVFGTAAAGKTSARIQCGAFGAKLPRIFHIIFWASVSSTIVLCLWIARSWMSTAAANGIGLTLYGLIGASLVFLSISERNRVFGIPIVGDILEYLGSRSYSMYLAHMTVINLWIAHTNFLRPSWIFESDFGRWLQLCAVLVITVISAELSYRLIEQPFLRISGRINVKRIG